MCSAMLFRSAFRGKHYHHNHEVIWQGMIDALLPSSTRGNMVCYYIHSIHVCEHVVVVVKLALISGHE